MLLQQSSSTFILIFGLFFVFEKVKYLKMSELERLFLVRSSRSKRERLRDGSEQELRLNQSLRERENGMMYFIRKKSC